MPATRRLSVGVALLAVAILPWLVWPWHDEPFSAPKRVGLALAAALLWGLRLALRHRLPTAKDSPILLDAACLAWIAAFASSALFAEDVDPAALWLGIAGPAWAMALARTAPAPSTAGRVMLAGATAMAVLCLAQWTGMDPFPALGWNPDIDGASSRLRVYGTLGNPNFVAAWLAMHLPLAATVAREARGRAAVAAGAAAALLLVAAIGATGSRGGALGAAAGLAAWALFVQARRALPIVAAAAVLLAALVWVSPARVLPQTAAGRFYILMVAAPHAFDRPLVGFGPGSFELHYPAWQLEGRRSGRLPSTLVRQFAGPQPHAHNDYLQAFLERGVPGGVTFLLVLATCFVRGARRQPPGPAGTAPATADPWRGALAAAVVAMAVCALVDFPFQRPAETMAFWTSAALLWARDEHGPAA